MTAVTMYTVAASTTAVIMGCHVSNLTSSAVTVTVKAAGATLVKDVSIAANSALDLLNGSRINLVATDTVTVQSSAPVSADAILSIMEKT
tara:strand:- start:249 stop:518 length:270 start_codon:yes stop_codon:yes gene_type:complete